MEDFRRSMHFGDKQDESTPAPVAAHHPAKKSRSLRTPGRAVLWVVFLVLLAAAVGTAAYYVNRYHDSQKEVKRLSNPQQVAQDQTKQLISQVGQLTVLPKNETPTVATVTDVTKLKDQPFFANAQNGDKVLIYTQAKEAYLYRPSTNKIINIAPVNIGNNQSSTTGTTTQNKTP